MEQKKRRVKKSPEELQKLAMIKYKQQLREHKTKIVKHAPQTELEKPVVIKTISAITEKRTISINNSLLKYYKIRRIFYM